MNDHELELEVRNLTNVKPDPAMRKVSEDSYKRGCHQTAQAIEDMLAALLEQVKRDHVFSDIPLVIGMVHGLRSCIGDLRYDGEDYVFFLDEAKKRAWRPGHLVEARDPL